VENEADVLALLEPLGFTCVDPGSLSVADQIRTFAEADVIVAAHGAALANLVFCSPGSAVVELFPAMSFVADYWKMASGVTGLEYRYLSGSGKPAGTTRAEFVVADITVDVGRLATVVEELLAAR
jgi:capsular polysaccharide biosynthesis protein